MSIKFDVLNRFTDTVQFTAEIDCDESEQRSVKLWLAIRWAVKNHADLSHVDLSYVDLSHSDLSHVDLSHADLSHADLSDADLHHADLRHADLRHANLCYANLHHADLYLGRNEGSRNIFMSHLGYFIFGYVARRKGKLSMCMEIGCKKYTVKTFERKFKNGDFNDEDDLIDVAMPYIRAVKADLKKIKGEIQ